MKKKFKDLTLDDCNEICKKHTMCSYCPLKSNKTNVRLDCYRDVLIDLIVAFDLEREVEIDE